MAVLWESGPSTVDRVRAQLPGAPAYTTVQTVLNRLVDRGLVDRERVGRSFTYTPHFEESQLLARSISSSLSGASPDARRQALLELVDGLNPSDIDEIARRANAIKRRRGRK